jgi:hypothetical protein
MQALKRSSVSGYGFLSAILSIWNKKEAENHVPTPLIPQYRTWQELGASALGLSAAVGIASWLGDSALMENRADRQPATWMVAGKSSTVFFLSAGSKVTGKTCVQRDDWPWCLRRQVPGFRKRTPPVGRSR